MCRLLGYTGKAVALSRLFHDPPHAMEHQSYAAKQMLEGHVNADGFGVAWYPPGNSAQAGSGIAGGTEEPLVYRSERPAWGDAVWRGLAPRLTARTTLMNVRNATDPATGGLASIHPFQSGRWTFTHNGYLTGFREHFLVPLTKRLSDERYRQRHGASDTETFFLLLMDRLESGIGPGEALVGLVETICEQAEKAQQPSFLNFLLSDGERVWATRAGTAPRQPTLWVAHNPARLPASSVVASEPLDEDGAWKSVPQTSLVMLRTGEPPSIRPLDDAGHGG